LNVHVAPVEDSGLPLIRKAGLVSGATGAAVDDRSEPPHPTANSVAPTAQNTAQRTKKSRKAMSDWCYQFLPAHSEAARRYVVNPVKP
jgi:hypothetical protein